MHKCDEICSIKGMPRGKDSDYEQRYRSAVASNDLGIIRMCLGKNSYETAEKAEEVARNRSSKTRRPLRVYECLHCHKFHLTKQPNRNPLKAA